jgi:phosphomannomutase/phosphoglucomutase
MTIDPNIFREYDIRGVAATQLHDASVSLIGKALGTWWRRNGAEKVALGFDARASSPQFCDILSRELSAVGCDVVLVGMVPTPVLYHTIYARGLDGGVMITGSHNPPDHNGFKICLGKAALFGSQIQEIRAIAENRERGEFAQGEGSVTEVAVLDEYLADIASRLELGDRKLKVVVDAGNGMGGVTAVPAYQKLGVDLIGLFTDPDPNFPNHDPDPAVEENLTHLIEAVREQKADVGLAFDGDGDRLGVVDETGRIIWGDELMVLFSRDVLAREPGATIIAEVKCSQTLYDDIASNGGDPLMWKTGHSLIKAKIKETGALLAGEMSGHFFFADRYYGFDDGCYAGARLLEILSRTDMPLSALLADIPKSFNTPELRIACPDDHKFDLVKNVAEHFAAGHDVVTIDGARVKFDDGWGLVRASNTQPMLVLRFEANSAANLERIRSEVEGVVNRLL